MVLVGLAMAIVGFTIALSLKEIFKYMIEFRTSIPIIKDKND
jgi:hypothetical protein